MIVSYNYDYIVLKVMHMMTVNGNQEVVVEGIWILRIEEPFNHKCN